MPTLNSPSQIMGGGDAPQRPIWSPRRLIALLGGGLVIVAVVLFGGLSYGRWQATLDESEQLTVNLADLLAEHAGRVLDASNLVADQAIMLVRGREWDDL